MSPPSCRHCFLFLRSAGLHTCGGMEHQSHQCRHPGTWQAHVPKVICCFCRPLATALELKSVQRVHSIDRRAALVRSLFRLTLFLGPCGDPSSLVFWAELLVRLSRSQPSRLPTGIELLVQMLYDADCPGARFLPADTADPTQPDQATSYDHYDSYNECN